MKRYTPPVSLVGVVASPALPIGLFLFITNALLRAPLLQLLLLYNSNIEPIYSSDRLNRHCVNSFSQGLKVMDVLHSRFDTLAPELHWSLMTTSLGISMRCQLLQAAYNDSWNKVEQFVSSNNIAKGEERVFSPPIFHLWFNSFFMQPYFIILRSFAISGLWRYSDYNRERSL